MTVGELHKKFTWELNGIYPPGETASIIKMIFQHFIGGENTMLFSDRDLLIDESTETKLENALKRLLTHEPAQYVTGEAWFYGLKFSVNEYVLIPRPETEELVDAVIKFLRFAPEKTVIDIGCGSGCIPVSIKKNIPAAEVIAADISKVALLIAEKNAAENNTAVRFTAIDFLDETLWDQLPAADIIISNPPYIPANERRVMDQNVTMHEPALALFVPENDPLLFYTKIRQFADTHLKKEGRLFLEMHEDFAAETAALFNNEKYSAEIKKDMSGKERMLLVTPVR